MKKMASPKTSDICVETSTSTISDPVRILFFERGTWWGISGDDLTSQKAQVL